ITPDATDRAARSGPAGVTPCSSGRHSEYRASSLVARYRRAERSQLLTSPPGSSFPLRGEVGEPVLPQHRSHHLWWPAIERISAKQPEHVRISLQQSLL